jgi:hypothetical protein
MMSDFHSTELGGSSTAKDEYGKLRGAAAHTTAASVRWRKRLLRRRDKTLSKLHGLEKLWKEFFPRPNRDRLSKIGAAA